MSGAPWWEDFRAAQAGPPGANPSAPQTAARVGTGEAPLTVEDPATGRGSGPAPRPPRGNRPLQVLAAALGVVFVVLVGLLGARVLFAPSDSAVDGAAPTTGSSSGVTSPDVVDTATGADPEAGGGTAAADATARAELGELRDSGLAAHPPRGQWVAQLAAKSIGTTDPVQTAANGSSTFYAADILAQSREIADGIAGGDVFVLLSTDFGQRSVDARDNPFWVTFAAGPFGEAADVQAWCDSVFASTPAEDRNNVCMPKQLLAPN